MLDNLGGYRAADPAKPKVIGVLMAYNCSRLLERAYQSIPFDCFDEIICVDDGSTDDTVAVAQRLGITVFTHPHTGYGGNLFFGFQKALEKISAGKFSKGELEEAIFGVIQTLDTPISPGNRAMTAYAWKRAERTDAERQAFRKAILKASKDEIVKAVKELLLPQEGTIVSFLGENLFQKESKKPSCNEIKFSV